MKKFIILLVILSLVGMASLMAASNDVYIMQKADRAGDLRIGVDVTVPAVGVMILLGNLLDVLVGPRVELGISDTFSLTASLSPLVKTSMSLTEAAVDTDFVGVGVLEAGARWYFTPTEEAFFFEADAAAIFMGAISDADGLQFEVSEAVAGVGAGYEFGNSSLSAGVYLISTGGLLGEVGDLSGGPAFIPISKISWTYML